jgi:dTDP-4-amino-4,6-dideoxygalactose transaminase
MSKKIPFLSLKNLNQAFENELQTAFTNFLDKGYYILGDAVRTFEEEFAAYCQQFHACGVANGLDALIIALDSYGFKKGSEVIVPANTYYASILAIIKAGLKPVLVEPNLSDYLIDVNLVEKHISPKTVAVLAVNLYGQMCDFRKLKEICSLNNLKLIVDAAQSHGAIYEDSKKCFGADAIAYSFYPSKNLGAFADAGALVSDDPDIILKAKAYRNYGSSKKYVFDFNGINSRLSELQASFLSVKLKYLDQEINYRRGLASQYLKEINNEKIILPHTSSINSHAWHLFTIRTKNRDNLITHLNGKGVGTDIHYPIPPHQQKALSRYKLGNFPITEQIHDTILSIPLNSCLLSSDISYIADCINNL